MKPFRFQKFEIKQSENVFRVGTDGVLLGALCTCGEALNILEVGCGTGLISLMLAQRNPSAGILAVDISPFAVSLADQNFSNSPFADRLSVTQVDYNRFVSDHAFSLIVCNPPYFAENSSTKDVLARQQTALDFSSLFKKSSELLTQDGLFSVIVPAEAEDEIINAAYACSLILRRKINVYGIERGPLRRLIMEFGFSPKNLVEEDYVIEKSPRKYSDQYLELTKEFHVFST